MKLTLSMVPISVRCQASTIPIDSGRIMATAAERRIAADADCRPPGNTSSPSWTRRFDDVRSADEFGHKTILRREIYVARRADLRNRALLHHHDAVAERHGLGLIMGHIDRGNTERAQ